MNHELVSSIKALPHEPGVYLFKDSQGQILYVGKAKDLRNRVNQYLQRVDVDLKAGALLEQSTTLDHIVAKTELEALLLEAAMIQNHQPHFNVLLKTGQPFLYVTITTPAGGGLPTLALVRNKKKRGVYFGPFIEKGPARRVFDFLQRTFKLRLCGKKIAGGCLYYHLGLCAGSCRDDFDEAAYRERIQLAQQALEKGHKKFLAYLQAEIVRNNGLMNFERSRELHQYKLAFEQIFTALDVSRSGIADAVKKDVWLLSPGGDELVFFHERDGVLKRKESLYFPLQHDKQEQLELVTEYFTSLYRERLPSQVILTNIPFDEPQRQLMQEFLQAWHKLDLPCTILVPTEGHYLHIVRMAQLQCERDQQRRATLGALLKRQLFLPREPRTIDCFDISHKQGKFMVGSCVRFTDGQPDKNKFRRFKINSITEQNDYAALREIVARRYRDQAELPDLILIDGGKGQLNAVIDLFPQAQFASLAKREETIFSRALPQGKRLDPMSYTGQMLIALRDYTHHFAISYHRQRETMFDEG